MKTKTVKELSYEVENLTKILNDLRNEFNSLKQELDNQKPPSRSNEKVKSNFTCAKCGECYESRGKLYSHIKESHKRTFACRECNFKGTSISALEEHISVNHYSETIKGYQCTQCNERFMSEWRLKMHECFHAHGYFQKFCHYYNNSTFCPYEKFGFKFRHSDANLTKHAKENFVLSSIT